MAVKVEKFPRLYALYFDRHSSFLRKPNQTNPVVVEPFSNVKAFFCRNKSTQLLVTLVKTLYIFFCTT